MAAKDLGGAQSAPVNGEGECLSRRVVLALLTVAAVALLATGCNVNKYDDYHSCSLSNGKYELRVSIAHDSSEPVGAVSPEIYANLCTELVGGPNVHISRSRGDY